jgi:hypothetical protein
MARAIEGDRIGHQRLAEATADPMSRSYPTKNK